MNRWKVFFSYSINSSVFQQIWVFLEFSYIFENIFFERKLKIYIRGSGKFNDPENSSVYCTIFLPEHTKFLRFPKFRKKIQKREKIFKQFIRVFKNQ